MDINERIKMLKAMDTVVRNMNDENAIADWLVIGLPDGAATDDEFDSTAEYVDDETFADIMDSFVYIMATYCNEEKVEREATLYCDGVRSKVC